MSQEKNVKSAFDQFAFQYQELYMSVDRYAEGLKVFCNSIKTSSPNILDVACGPGNLSRFIQDAMPDAQIAGFDLSPKMVELARNNVQIGKFSVQNLSFIKSHQDFFNGILIGFLLPYISPSQFRNLLKDCHLALKSGGIIYFSGNEGPPEKSGMEYGSKGTGPGIMSYYYETEFLIETLESTGFEIIWQKSSLNHITENWSQQEFEFVVSKQ